VSANPSHAADEASEALLLERLRAGDEAAYALLVRDFGGRMLAATRRILGNEEDAQDAVQEAFLSAFKALERFHGEAQVSTWLHRIAINAALMKLRAPQSWSEPADDPLVRAETRAVVRRSIDQLPDNYRNALLLRDIEGLDNEELAAQLGITVNAAKIRVHRARQALRTLLDPHFASVQE
jgi:RNA polymerase sigma-70 factor (ECF subfamily)